LGVFFGISSPFCREVLLLQAGVTHNL
jgi:hypothetical protein